MEIKNIIKKHDNNRYINLYWSFWAGYYEYARNIGVEFDDERFDLFIKFNKNINMFLAYDGLFIFCQKPKYINWKELESDSKYVKKENTPKNRILHCDGGKSIEYNDGWKTYHLNNVAVSQYLAETPSGLLEPKKYLEIKNIDEKAEFIKKIGIDRMIEMGEVVDTFEKHKYSHNYKWYAESEYKVVDMHCLFPNKYSYLPYLYMKNQTTGIYHLECCYNPKLIQQPRTIIEALQVRMGGVSPEDTEIMFIK